MCLRAIPVGHFKQGNRLSKKDPFKRSMAQKQQVQAAVQKKDTPQVLPLENTPESPAPLLEVIGRQGMLPREVNPAQVYRLQPEIGNRAIQRMAIQRNPPDTAGPNELPVIMPWTAGAMSPLEMVRFRAETMLNETFGERIKTIRNAAGMQVTQLDSDELKKEYARKAAEQAGKTSPDEIQQYVDNRNRVYPGTLEGFAFQSRNIVYVNKAAEDDEQVVTLVHEMLHMNAASDWQATVKADIDEGTTELLTQKACAKMKATKKAYGAQMGIVQKIIQVVGEGTLINAYFNGGSILVNAVDSMIGKGTFNTLLDRIMDRTVIGTFDEKIGKLLDPQKANWLRQKIDEMKGLLGGWVTDANIDRIAVIRGMIDQEDMPQVRQELYPLINSLWSERQQSRMIEIMS